MLALLAQCRWPSLPEPYDSALRAAVAFVLGRFDVLGIVASGTIIRGNPNPASDLDLYVILSQPRRQRIQKFFNSVPAEIFVNSVTAIEGYFDSEHKAARPLTAHMLATGFVILDRDPVVESLRQRASALLADPPRADDAERTRRRYAAALLLEDARDIAMSDPDGANMMLGLAVHDMLRYVFRRADQYLPRDKDLLTAVQKLDPRVARYAREFFAIADIGQRLTLAEAIADRTIEARGFFEWESSSENA